MKKINVGIIGSGNIGCDLLVKIQRSAFLHCAIMMGRHATSRGMQFARSMGTVVTDQSIQYLIEHPEICDIVFDATSASEHLNHAPILRDMKKFAIDLTPSLVGEMCIPAINGDACLDAANINMVTCGGQASVPLFYAISDVQDGIDYFELVASIASKSAGIGTRDNIDEFTQTTKESIIRFSHARDAKAIIIINPAEPPILMNNTLFARIENPDLAAITASVKHMEKKIQQYVPGYRIKLGPLYKEGLLTTMVEVIGHGDYLPNYSGNLDIITCAAVNMAERYAQRRLSRG